MKYILSYKSYNYPTLIDESTTTLDQDITQSVEDKYKEIQDYNTTAPKIINKYKSADANTDADVKKIIDKTVVKKDGKIKENEYLIKLAQLQKDNKRLKELETNIGNEQAKLKDLSKPPVDKTQKIPSDEIERSKLNINNMLNELNELKKKIDEYKKFDNTMKTAAKGIKKDVDNLKKLPKTDFIKK